MKYYVVAAPPCGPNNDRPDWRRARTLSGLTDREAAERMAEGMRRSVLFAPRVYVVCEPHELRGYPRRQAIRAGELEDTIVIEMGWDMDLGTQRA